MYAGLCTRIYVRICMRIETDCACICTCEEAKFGQIRTRACAMYNLISYSWYSNLKLELGGAVVHVAVHCSSGSDRYRVWFEIKFMQMHI